jgi:hypothetical protein
MLDMLFTPLGEPKDSPDAGNFEFPIRPDLPQCVNSAQTVTGQPFTQIAGCSHASRRNQGPVTTCGHGEQQNRPTIPFESVPVHRTR